MIYGEESRTVTLGSLIPDVPDAAVEVSTENSMSLLHARVRAERRTGRWRPCADGQLGFTDLYTTTSVLGAFQCSGSSPAECSQTNLGDATHSREFVLSYGGAAGLLIGFGSSPQSPRLDLSVRYHRGNEAQYLTEGAIRIEGGRALMDFSHSRTDMVIFYAGVALGR
jgi:hypothetical protein